jgi:hypothetical protein
MGRKTLREFIQENRSEIDSAINRVLNHVPKQASCSCPLSGTEHDHSDGRTLDDEDRREWILSDEGLYNWARSVGVRI